MKFHEMTWPLLREVSREDTVVLAPIAACEQHSRHLPTWTDTLLAPSFSIQHWFDIRRGLRADDAGARG